MKKSIIILWIVFCTFIDHMSCITCGAGQGLIDNVCDLCQPGQFSPGGIDVLCQDCP